MITRTFIYKEKEYTLTIKRENLGSASEFFDQGWIAMAVDSRNAQYAKFKIKDSILNFVAGRSGTDVEKFIVDILENEVQLRVDDGLKPDM